MQQLCRATQTDVAKESVAHDTSARVTGNKTRYDDVNMSTHDEERDKYARYEHRVRSFPFSISYSGCGISCITYTIPLRKHNHYPLLPHEQ